MKLKNLIFISTIFVILHSCFPYVKVENYDKLTNVYKIKEHKYLENVIPTDYVFFFNKMINQQLSKIYGNNWEMFVQDSLNVYYGYSLLTKEGVYTDQIYSINKSELKKQFPFYDKIEFYRIKCQLLDYAYKDFDFGYDHYITFAKDSIYMTSQGIVVDTQRKYRTKSQHQLFTKKKKVHFEILVDKQNLDLINKREIK